MTQETVSVRTTVAAPPETVFDVLADPSSHAAIDGTGWVRDAVDGTRLAEVGQVFRIAMYHDNHPNGHYEMANAVRAFDPPRTISWEPGQDLAGDGDLKFGGWIWRYDLAADGAGGTEVTMTYDWSAVPVSIREYIEFPPFGLDHLENSLAHLAGLALDPGRARTAR